MEASSSAPVPHQVNLIIWRFAGPTSGTVACAHGSLDSPSCDLDVVCRLRNVVVDVLRKPVKMSCELHQPGRLVLAAFRIKFPCSQQAVSGTHPPKDQCDGALLDHHRRLLRVDLCVCAGGCACSNLVVGTPTFAFGRPPQTCCSAQSTGAARARRSGVAASACSWLTVPRTHDSGPDFR